MIDMESPVAHTRHVLATQNMSHLSEHTGHVMQLFAASDMGQITIHFLATH
jgi:hypothetical protein